MLTRPITRGITRPITRPLVRQSSAFDPLTLFANGEQGVWFDPSDLTTLFQDDAGTTPVTADGDPVGLMLDKSGNGNHASQSVAASRPFYRPDGAFGDYDGVDDFLDTNVTEMGSTRLFCGPSDSFFIATCFKLNPNNSGTLVAKGGDGTSGRTFHALFSEVRSAGNPYFILRGRVTDTNWGLDDGDLHCVWVNWDGETATAGYDNVANMPLNVGDAPEETNQRILIGARTNGPNFTMRGTGGSNLIIDRHLSPSEIEKVVSALLRNHGVQL